MAVQAIGARPTQLVRCALVPLARAQGRGRVCRRGDSWSGARLGLLCRSLSSPEALSTAHTLASSFFEALVACPRRTSFTLNAKRLVIPSSRLEVLPPSEATSCF